MLKNSLITFMFPLPFNVELNVINTMNINNKISYLNNRKLIFKNIFIYAYIH